MVQSAETLPTWDLSDLYSGVDDPRLEADMQAGRRRAEEFARRFKGSIAVAELNSGHLRAALDEYEALLRNQYRPQAFASLLFSTNTQDPARGALLQKSREFGSAVGIHLVFFDLEIGQIPAATYEKVSQNPELAPYRHYLDHQRKLAVHNLSEPEEKILVETANVRGQAFSRLSTEINTRTRYRVEREGQVQEMTQSQVLALLHDADRSVRQAAAESVTAALKHNAHLSTFIYNTLLHEKDVLDRLRHYESPAASRHLDNELGGEVVEVMSQVCADNFDIVAEYYHLKRRLLELDELTHYDRYAPIAGEEEPIAFAQAQGLVLEAFGGFSPRLAEMAAPFFSKRWIDAALADGKRGGAFCAVITPDHHPYVLLNYTSQPRDVMTLAHELGHGIHDILASRNHLLDYYPVLPMAETASTFGEILVFEHLQKSLSSSQDRLALLCHKIEDTFATVFRQIAMYRFEQEAHQARRTQGELPAEKFDALWQQHMQAMFGDALKLGEGHACWWSYIPHIVSTPFYVYAYAFGELLVLALYACYQREGQTFVEKYFSLLAAGGSCSPAELVGAMGFDIASREFWQGGCDLIRQRVEEAKKLAG